MPNLRQVHPYKDYRNPLNEVRVIRDTYTVYSHRTAELHPSMAVTHCPRYRMKLGAASRRLRYVQPRRSSAAAPIRVLSVMR